MRVLRLLAWTPLRDEPEAVWPVVTTPAQVGGLLAPWCRWSTSEPGFAEALAEARPSAWRGRLSLGKGGLPLTLTLKGGRAGMRLHLHTAWSSRGEATWRRRLERTLGGGVRLVDELLVRPDLGLVVPLLHPTLQATMHRVHQGLVQGLHPRGPTTTRAWKLVDHQLGHADPVLDVLDGPDPARR